MKKTLCILSLLFISAFSTAVLNAQSIEQISYMPVKRGNYKNLMVKKQAFFGGDLLVKNTLTANSTFLNLKAINSLSLGRNVNINANNNVFISGIELQVSGSVAVYGSNTLAIHSGEFTKIDRVTGMSNLFSQNLTAINSPVQINELYIDGIIYPTSCMYQWISNVRTAGGGRYTILKCAD